MASNVIRMSLHPKQALVFTSEANEILYGGSAGGGKSHVSRVLAIALCLDIPGLQVYMFRRHYDDLIKNHMEGPTGYREMLHILVERKLVEIVETEIRFYNGSKIYLCHCQHEKDKYKYQGAEMHVLILEEGTQFEESIIRFLRHRARVPSALKIPEKYKDKLPFILITSNPGGVGHGYIKQAFIDARPPYEIEKVGKSEGGFYRQFVPASLDDNPSIDKETYTENLSGLGDPNLVKAMLNGDWDVVTGSMFPELSRDKHMIKPFIIPAHWTRFRTFDWGSYHPFSVGWWAVASGELAYSAEGDRILMPRGSLIRYREWYGCVPGSPNKGVNLTNEQIIAGIHQRTPPDEKIYETITDSLPFQNRGGISIAETFDKYGIDLTEGDTKRIPGWAQVRSRLVGVDGQPLIYFFNTCLDGFRTLSSLQRDDKKPEDVNNNGEDHAPDEIRLACMSRKLSKILEPITKPRGLSEISLNELYDENKRAGYIR